MSNRPNGTAKSLRAARGRRPRSRKTQLNQVTCYGSTLHLSRPLAIADGLQVKLRYILPIQTIGATASVLNSLRFTSNAYDVDPSLGSTAMTGFAEYATIYSRFRTLDMSYDFTVVNLDAVGKEVISGFLTASVAATALGSNYAENPYWKRKMIATSQGTSLCNMKGSLAVAKLFGTTQALHDDLFVGTTTSSTLSANATMNVYIGCNSPIVPVNGFTVSGSVTLNIHFFRRNALLT
jgi:hypothetical protein